MTAFKSVNLFYKKIEGGKKQKVASTHLYYFYSSFPGKEKEKKKGMVNVGIMGKM